MVNSCQVKGIFFLQIYKTSGNGPVSYVVSTEIDTPIDLDGCPIAKKVEETKIK